jgi:hypothetical protein
LGTAGQPTQHGQFTMQSGVGEKPVSQHQHSLSRQPYCHGQQTAASVIPGTTTRGGDQQPADHALNAQHERAGQDRAEPQPAQQDQPASGTTMFMAPANTNLLTRGQYSVECGKGEAED